MNIKILYPTAFEQKVILLEGSGKEPVEVNLIAPSLVKPGESFAVKAAVYDENGFSSACCDAELGIKLEQDDSLICVLPFEKGKPAIAAIGNIVIEKEGLYRFEAELNGKSFKSNPVYCSKSNNGQIYWGDPHIHTNLSNCHPDKCRSLNFCFIAARYGTGLDWASAADHVSNGRCEYAKWKEQVAVANQFNEPPDFVTMPAYEASLNGGCGGDNNIYMTDFPEMFIDDYEEGNIKTLVNKLKGKMDENDFLAVPHHTTRNNKHGEIPDEIYPGEQMMPVVEIHSKWGTSEYRGNPNPLKTIHDGPSYVNDLLQQGLPLGFIGGTDSHSSLTTGHNVDNGLIVEAEHISALPGMTAIMAENLSRKSIISALKKRRCYAVSGDRTLIAGSVNGRSFGEKISVPDTGSVEIKAIIAAKTDIENIEIVRNGQTLFRCEPETWQTVVEYSDHDNLAQLVLTSPHIGRFVYYYIRVTCKNGAQAWSSPVWIIL